jgi:single-stranded DNA-binding protein
MRKDMYKGTICRMTLIGYMEGVPVMHTTSSGHQLLSFFIARIRPSAVMHNLDNNDQREWYRVYVKNENAAYIKAYGHSGMYLTVHGISINCVIEKINHSEFIVTEVFAEKIFFLSQDELHQKINAGEVISEVVHETIFPPHIVSSTHIACMH